MAEGYGRNYKFGRGELQSALEPLRNNPPIQILLVLVNES
jgi:hypothetical protein